MYTHKMSLPTSHEVLQRLIELVPAEEEDVHRRLQSIKGSFSYWAPELKGKRWDALFLFIIEVIVPAEEKGKTWTEQIKTYWNLSVPQNESD